jgi:hypothetical protein
LDTEIKDAKAALVQEKYDLENENYQLQHERDLNKFINKDGKTKASTKEDKKVDAKDEKSTTAKEV